MIRTAALFSTLTAVLLALGLAAAAPSQAARVARDVVQVGIDDIAPQVLRAPDTQLKVTGAVTNGGSTPYAGLPLRIRYSSHPLARRSDLGAYLAGQEGYDLSWRIVMRLPQIDPSGRVPFELLLTPRELKMSQAGIYPLTIEVLAPYGGQPIAVQRTFLPYVPAGQKMQRAKLALVLPIIDRPHRADDATFMDDGLRASLTGDGRLARLLEIAQSGAKGVTWFVDPALLDDVQQTTKPYTLRASGPPKPEKPEKSDKPDKKLAAEEAAAGRVDPGDDTERRPADPSAADWLRNLQTALADAPVVATPYADPDIAALVHNGIDGAAAAAIAKAQQVTPSLLGKEAPATINWPAEGVLDRDALDELSISGVHTVLLSAANLPAGATAAATGTTGTTDSTGSTDTTGIGTAAKTPATATPIDALGGTMTVLAADPVLSGLVDEMTAKDGGSAVATQRFLAETALIAATTPRTTVVAAPPRRWDPDPDAVAHLLHLTSTLPWLRPATLDSIKKPAAHAPRVADLVYSADQRQAELSKKYLTGVRDLEQQATLTSQVTGADTGQFAAALLRLESSAWRGHGAEAGRRVRQVRAAVVDRIDDISITGADTPRVLAGANGSVAISVHNGTAKEVNLAVRITSRTPKLLQIITDDDSGALVAPIFIRPGNNQTIQVPMTAQGGVEATVRVQLTTRDGVPYGPPTDLIVQATGYTGIALVIVGGALTVMLAAVIMRILRRSRPRRGTRKESA